MGKIVVILLVVFLSSFSPVFGKDSMISKYSADINNDGKIEHLTHEYFGGTGGYGVLQICNDKGVLIFKKEVQGDPYFVQSLNPRFFRDVDKDGLIEVLVGRQEYRNNLSNVDAPWIFDVYKWNGLEYKNINKIPLIPDGIPGL
ncbi:MAG: hypothetical protein NT099_08400 [Candidatus Saganbacteria bacterium]|nr:hypothetical protein [Candidatus Saganbacteria bacterium]